jgi:serine protease Do
LFLVLQIIERSSMNSSTGSWKLLFLALALGGPVGFWLFSSSGTQPSVAYAQQIAESQRAKGALDQGSTASADQLSKVFRDVAKSLKPSVVSIKNVVERSVRSGKSRGQFRGLPPEIEQFFGRPLDGPNLGEDDTDGSLPRGRFENGLGSGVIVRSDGYILTNNHVVEGASVLEVVLSDERKVEAKVVGTDVRTDLAVLKIDATGLVAAQLGQSSAMEVGDWVIAIGSPFGLAQTVTAGIVSATNRSDQGITPYDSFIQTDAAINPGNSGGPLLNLRGEVIGINTAIASRGGGYNGVCFAVPSDTAQRVLNDLISKGRVTRGVIGLHPETLTPQLAEKLSLPRDQRGAYVVSVNKDFPAEKAGLRKGDVITAINGQPIISDSSMRRTIGETRPGTQVRVSYLRDGKPAEVTVLVQELDENQLAASSNETIEAFGLVVGPVSQEAQEEYGLRPNEGVEVKGVNRKGPFAGLIPPGVVVLSVNGVKVNSTSSFVEAMQAAGSKGIVKLSVRDSEADKTVTIRVQ